MFLKKEENHTTKGVRVEWGARGCPIYTQHCKHTQSILHVLQSGVCMSVCPSVSLGAVSQEPCPTIPLHSHLLAPPWEQNPKQQYGPQFWWEPAGKAWVSASTLAPESCVRVCVCVYVCVCVHAHECARVCVHVCTWGTCVQICTRGRVTSQRRAGGAAPGKACWGWLAHK